MLGLTDTATASASANLNSQLHAAKAGRSAAAALQELTVHHYVCFLAGPDIYFQMLEAANKYHLVSSTS